MADFIPYAELTPEQKALVDSFFTYRRVEAAKRGLGLDKLVADKKPAVRLEVAEHEYGLDKLFKDPDPLVAEAAERCLGVLTLKEWIDQNPDRCVIFWNQRPIWTPEQLAELKAQEEKRQRIAESIDASFDPVPAHPSYTAEELLRMLSECDGVAYVTYWTREDIVNEVESLGFDPDTPGLFEAVSKEFSNALEDASESFAILDDIIRDKAAGIAPGELLPEVQRDVKSNSTTGKPERAESVDELAARGAAKAEEHNRNLQSPQPKPEMRKR